MWQLLKFERITCSVRERHTKQNKGFNQKLKRIKRQTSLLRLWWKNRRPVDHRQGRWNSSGDGGNLVSILATIFILCDFFSYWPVSLFWPKYLIFADMAGTQPVQTVFKSVRNSSVFVSIWASVWHIPIVPTDTVWY